MWALWVMYVAVVAAMWRVHGFAYTAVPIATVGLYYYACSQGALEMRGGVCERVCARARARAS
jgi:hypothetical protein